MALAFLLVHISDIGHIFFHLKSVPGRPCQMAHFSFFQNQTNIGDIIFIIMCVYIYILIARALNLSGFFFWSPDSCY